MPSITASVSGSASWIVMPRPRSDLSEIRPPISWILLRTTSMPTPRPEMSEIVSAVEKPGSEDEIVDLVVGQRRIRTDQPLLARLLEHALGIDAGAVVADLDDDPAAAMLGAEVDRALFVLAGGQAVGRRLDAVVDRVADDVGQRIAEPLDDRTVDLGRFAGHLEPDLLDVLVESSRTSRGMRWNTAPTGWARIDITLSFSSRV